MHANLKAFAVSVAVFPVAAVLFVSVLDARRPSLGTAAMLLAVGMTAVLLAESIVLAPLLVFATRLGIPPMARAALGALHGWIPVLLVAIVLGDGGWWRMPAELLVWLLPAAASGVVLARLLPQPAREPLIR